jgi:hypothetical protein
MSMGGIEKFPRFSRLAAARPRPMARYVSSVDWPGALRTFTVESSTATAALAHKAPHARRRVRRDAIAVESKQTRILKENQATINPKNIAKA